MFARHLPRHHIQPHDLWTFPRLRTRRFARHDGSPGVAVAEQLAVAPHPEQLDGALSDPFETPDPIESQDDLATSVPPAEEGPLVVSPSSSAPANPDSSVIASSSS